MVIIVVVNLSVFGSFTTPTACNSAGPVEMHFEALPFWEVGVKITGIERV